jgi:hypothetical protein
MDDDKKVTIHERKDTNENGIPDDEELQSCCSGTSDRRFLVFITQLFITISIVVLCTYKLGTELDCEASQLYNSLLSVVIGFWLTKVKDH